MAKVEVPNTLAGEKKQWLVQVIGGKDLFDGSTGLIATDADGNEIDLNALEREVGNYEEGQDPSGVAEKRKLLKQMGIPSVADISEEFNEGTKARDKALSDLRNLIELQKDEIRNATDYEVEVKRRVEVFGHEFLFGSKTVETKTKSKKGVLTNEYDSMSDKEYDTEHYQGRVIKGPSPEQKKALDLVIGQLELLTNRLKNNEDFEFSPQELMNEMWTPLVREGLVSEDQCPQEFSRVIQLFQGASALYNKRLEAQARKEVDRFENVRDHIDDVSEALGVGAAVVDIVLSLVGGTGQAQEIVKLSTKCVQGSMKTASALMEKQANFKDAASSLGGVLETVISSSIGGDRGKKIGKLAKSGFSGAVSLGLFAKKIAERNYDDGFELLAGAMESSLGCIADATGNKKLAKASANIAQAMRTSKDLAKLAYLMSQSPVDVAAVKELLKKIASEAVKKGIRIAIEEGVDKKPLQEAEDKLAKLKEGTEEHKKAQAELDKLTEDQDAFKDGLDKIFDGLLEGGSASLEALTQKVETAALERGRESAEAEIAAENETFNKRLGVAFGMSIGSDDADDAMLEDLYSIDALIAQIEKDRAMLQLFNVIFDAAGAVVTMIIPQLGGPLKAKAFAMNVVAAAERSADLLTFTSLVDDARKATSPQGPALLAQVDELKRHLTNDTLEAAIAFGQAVSLSLAAAGDLAAGAMGTGAAVGIAGRSVSAGLDAFKKAKDLLKKKFEDKKTARAWDMYKKALSSPRDRRHILKTFRANPTLAKYCIAYGAIHMDDPIARETLRQLGLNDMTLAQENSNANKVVQFLEVKFSDDIVVEGIVNQFAPSEGDPLSLTVWVNNKEAAAHIDNMEDERWQTVKTNAIDAAMIKVEDLEEQVGKNDLASVYKLEDWADCLQLWKDYIAAYEELQAALVSFKPMNVKNQPFKRFQSYLDELHTVAGKKIVEANEKIKTQTSLLKSRKSLCEKTSQNATASVEAISKAVPLLGAPQGRRPEELIELFSTGAAGVLLKEVSALTTETPQLVPHADLLAHAVNFASRMAARAINTAEKNPSQAAIMADDCVRTLLSEFAIARASFEDEAKKHAIDLKSYETIAL